MILLVLVTIYIWKKFSALAKQKSLNATRWAMGGISLYLGFGIGLQFVLWILVAMGMFDLDAEDYGVNLLVSIVCYAIGGFAAYLLYQKLQSTEDAGPDIDSFGKPDQNFS